MHWINGNLGALASHQAATFVAEKKKPSTQTLQFSDDHWRFKEPIGLRKNVLQKYICLEPGLKSSCAPCDIFMGLNSVKTHPFKLDEGFSFYIIDAMAALRDDS